MRTSLIKALLALAGAIAWPSLAAADPPAGPAPAPDAPAASRAPAASPGVSVLGRTLSAGLKRSRDAAREGSKPVPENIRKALAPFYAPSLLAKVRYKVGDVSPDGLAGFAIRNGQAAAVTLIDTIVFKDERYVDSIPLWAHEMHHVEQYAEWGLEGFASRYALGWAKVEEAARVRTAEFIAWRDSRK